MTAHEPHKRDDQSINQSLFVSGNKNPYYQGREKKEKRGIYYGN